ncbi:hypothetical protein Tco_0351028, partial [Tanacetum coccineum]
QESGTSDSRIWNIRFKNLEHQIQEKDNVIRNLKAQVSNMNDRSCETYNAKDVTALIEQNERVRVELEKVKQHYKELYDSIREIIEEARVVKPLDNALNYACQYTKLVGIYIFDETKEQKNETRRTTSALWDSRRLEVKQ